MNEKTTAPTGQLLIGELVRNETTGIWLVERRGEAYKVEPVGWCAFDLNLRGRRAVFALIPRKNTARLHGILDDEAERRAAHQVFGYEPCDLEIYES